MTTGAHAPALQIPFRVDDGVHRAGARPGDGLHVEATILEDVIKHAPGEGAVGAAALQGEIDLLLAVPVDDGLFHYSAVQPPSMEIFAPVICAAASEHRNTASAAT